MVKPRSSTTMPTSLTAFIKESIGDHARESISIRSLRAFRT